MKKTDNYKIEYPEISDFIGTQQFENAAKTIDAELKAIDDDVARVNSDLTKHKHSASDITSGILPIERGGLGVTTIEAAKEELGINLKADASDVYNKEQLDSVFYKASDIAKLSGQITIPEGETSVTHSESVPFEEYVVLDAYYTHGSIATKDGARYNIFNENDPVLDVKILRSTVRFTCSRKSGTNTTRPYYIFYNLIFMKLK